MRFIALFSTILLGTSFLTGCAHRYVEPTAGSTAKVTFINKTPVDALLKVMDNENCDRNEIYGNLGVITGNKGLFDLPSSKTALIRADRPLVMLVQGVQYGYMNYSCHMTIQADLEKDAEYEFEFTTDYRRCQVNLTKIKDSNNRPRRIGLPIKENPKSCWSILD